jgi:predicted nucleic acid-binding protein
MTFDQIPTGTEVFLDANALIYHFTNDSSYGGACTRLVERIEQRDLIGYASAHVLADTAHRLMTLEAMDHFGWPIAGLAARLRKHHTEISKLSLFERAVDQVPRLGVQVLPVTFDLVLAAATASRRFELLSGDAQIVAIMAARSLTCLASNDSDFDRVPWIKRFAPA